MLVDNGIYVVTIIIYMYFVISTEWVLEYLFSVLPRYNWNIIESGVKHQNLKPYVAT